MQTVFYIIRRTLCFTRLVHLHSKWEDDGIHCEDCGHFKTKAEHMADLHAGGGW